MKKVSYIILILLSIALNFFFSSCKDDPCQEQYCLNGGSCVEGDCICPNGWMGEHCEQPTSANLTYDCSNGNCLQVTGGAYASLIACQNNCSNSGSTTYNCSNGNCITANGGTYNSLTACQNACGGNSGGNNTYNCNNGNCIATTGGAYSSLASCQAACGNSNQSFLEFYNRTFTDMTITANNITSVIPPGESASIEGTPGTSTQVLASTSGKTAQGNTVGIALNWDFNKTFPNTGTLSTDLNVSAEYFFLYIRNQGSTELNNLYVNYGLTTQTLDNIVIPNDGTTYRIGYYRAWSNTSVRAYRPNGTSYVYWDHGTHFTLPFTNNQSTTLNAN